MAVSGGQEANELCECVVDCYRPGLNNLQGEFFFKIQVVLFLSWYMKLVESYVYHAVCLNDNTMVSVL